MKNNKVKNLKNYLTSKKVLNTIMSILEYKNIDIDTFIEIINTAAELVQVNSQCKYNKIFCELADNIVDIIELYHNENININNAIKNLKLIICKLINDLNDNIKINIYFVGSDKYNILTDSLNYKFITVNDTEKIKRPCIDNNIINILIISEETANYDLDLCQYYDDIIYYDESMNYLFNISESIYYNNYDYYYLIKTLEESKNTDLETIIVGNSYPLTGIDTSLMSEKAISLSLSSQDLYYSYRLAEMAIKNNTNIKRCIIGGGYYLVNHDLSKSKNIDAINRIKRVYYPILKDKHNAEYVDTVEILTIKKVLNNDVIDYIFNLEYLDKYFKNLIYKNNKGYFNKSYTRENNNMLGSIKMCEISEEDKIRLGQIRADQHNKLSKYCKTSEEYNYVLNKFINFLVDNNVEPIIVIFPATKYYRKFLDEKYEKEFYRIINELKERFNITIIDFYKQDIFSEEDFIDFDHLSGLGAIKITEKINEFLSR